MHTAQLLSAALEVARNTGFQVREESLEGAGGGHCLIRGQKWLLIDLTQTQQEQLDDVLDALRSEPQLELARVPCELLDCLRLPKAA
jgi:Spy/CpxP family protein refolding chaperone